MNSFFAIVMMFLWVVTCRRSPFGRWFWGKCLPFKRDLGTWLGSKDPKHTSSLFFSLLLFSPLISIRAYYMRITDVLQASRIAKHNSRPTFAGTGAEQRDWLADIERQPRFVMLLS